MRTLPLALLVSLSLTACGSSSKPAAVATTTAPAGRPTVFAAASLTEAFTDIGDGTFTFAGSQLLVTQIQQGAPADVFASADQKNMQKLVAAGLVEPPQVFAHNELEIAVAPGNPKHVTGLADLARSDLVVVLDDPSVPAGAYTAQALAKAATTVRAKSLELDVKSALAKVTSGEADATVVYTSDVKAAGAKAGGVTIPAAQNVVASYPVAVLKASTHQAAAKAFVARLLSATGQRALKKRGFLPA